MKKTNKSPELLLTDLLYLNRAIYSLSDINECAFEGQCIAGTCQNTFGSFRCQCPRYYELDGSGRICKGIPKN